MFHRHFQKSARLQELSSGWKQAFILLSLVLFVLSAIFPANSGEDASGGSMAIPSPREVLFCDGNPKGRDDAHEGAADQVRYVDGLGFVIPRSTGQGNPSLKLSEHF